LQDFSSWVGGHFVGRINENGEKDNVSQITSLKRLSSLSLGKFLLALTPFHTYFLHHDASRIRPVQSTVNQCTRIDRAIYIIDSCCQWRWPWHTGAWLPGTGPVHRSFAVLDKYCTGRCMVFGCFCWAGWEKISIREGEISSKFLFILFGPRVLTKIYSI